MGSGPNTHLTALVSEAGYSNKELARELRAEGRAQGVDLKCTHVDIARWLAGTQPRGRKPALLAAVMSRRLNRVVTPADLGMARSGTLDRAEVGFSEAAAGALHLVRMLTERDLHGDEQVQYGLVPTPALVGPMASWLVSPDVESSARSSAGPRVGFRDVERVRAALRMWESLDHQYGGGHARLAAVQYLRTTVSPMLEASYPARVGEELFAVASQLTYKTGAMAYDVGMHGLARRYFLAALNLAHQASDRALGGKCLALMSHQANFLGEYRHAVDLARAAKLGAKGQSTPAVHAMYCAMEARALANLGDKRACVTALTEAEQSYARTGTAAEPDWIAYFTQSELHDEFAHCFTALRDTPAAIRFGRLAIGESQDPYRRSRIFCRLTLAQAHVVDPRPRRRDVEQACDVAGAGVEEMGMLDSARVRSYAHTFVRLLKPYGGVDAVIDLRHRLTEANVTGTSEPSMAGSNTTGRG